MTESWYGSDVIVALLAEAGIEYVAFNPGASFRGIHDSLVHGQTGPRIVLCLHEAVSVAVAQGYAKAAGKPMAVLLHDIVGLQNGLHGDLQRMVRSRPGVTAWGHRTEVEA